MKGNERYREIKSNWRERERAVAGERGWEIKGNERELAARLSDRSMTVRSVYKEHYHLPHLADRRVEWGGGGSLWLTFPHQPHPPIATHSDSGLLQPPANAARPRPCQHWPGANVLRCSSAGCSRVCWVRDNESAREERQEERRREVEEEGMEERKRLSER